MEILQSEKFKFIKKCPICNEENDKDANWCLECGKAIVSVEVRRCQLLKGDAKPYIPLSYNSKTNIMTNEIKEEKNFSYYTHSASYDQKADDSQSNSPVYCKSACQDNKKIDHCFYAFDDLLYPGFAIYNPILGYVFPSSNVVSNVEIHYQQQIFKNNEKQFYQKVHAKKKKSLQKKSKPLNIPKLKSCGDFTGGKKQSFKISPIESFLPFPDEVILCIMSYLSLSDILNMSCVCKQLYRIGMDDSLWKVIRIKRHCYMTDLTLSKIAKRHPEVLSITQCNGKRLTEDGLKHLFLVVSDSLKDFSISGCSGGVLNSEAVLLHLASHCKNIEILDISWSNVTNIGITAICLNLPRIVCLLLNGCQGITNDSIVQIAEKYSESLKTLEIFGCFNVSPQTINKLIEKCFHIRKLNLGQCHKVTNNSISLIAKHLKKLQSLDIRGCMQVRDNSLCELIENCHELTSLVVANCPAITDITLYSLSNHSSIIKNLDACGCGKITDKGVRSLVKGCTKLQSLDLSSTKVTGRSVISISTFCSNTLQSLRLSFCNALTDASLYALVSKCQKLRTLHLYGCKTVRNLGKLVDINSKLKIEKESLR
ncbi:F-box/LRR-repeat protein 7 isoform X1 [Hydra vulgaris]|uniref:F-box/LRR-repeat protein 7 isoform X1 n=1 Tax=Hydra vulgaris TaxID=6087 RepID=UPI001F5E43F9|nr:F-box/LRR-repeat protein 7-like isoform X1 [Hydra vulgaris]